MPPKKAEEDLSSLPPFKPLTILPILALPSKLADQVCLYLSSKKLSYQKNYTLAVAMEILKEKGLYVEPKKDPKAPATEPQKSADRATENQRIVKELGLDLLAKNYNLVVNQLIVQARKEKKDKMDGKEPGGAPQAAAKKEAKKETKKDAKKQTKVEEPPPPEEPKVPQKVYKMDADGFVVLLDFPRSISDYEKILENPQNVPIDLVVLIEEKVMWQWQQPNLKLLQQPAKNLNELKRQIQSPSKAPTVKHPAPSEQDNQSVNKQRQLFQRIQSSTKSTFRSMWYQLNPYKPEVSTAAFVDKLFTEAATFSFDRTSYENWLKDTTTVPMVPPIKIVEKVLVEEKVDETKKKDTKKAPKGEVKEDKPPEYVDRIREIKYEDQPQNIKSDLKALKEVNRVRPPHTVTDLLTNLLEAIDHEAKAKNKQHKQESQISSQQIDKIFLDQEQLLKHSPSAQPNILEHKVAQSISASSENPLIPQSGINFTVHEQVPKLSTLACMSNMSASTLLRSLVLKNFEAMASEAKKYRSWSFINRNYAESYDSSTLQQVLSKELTSQPQIIAWDLPHCNLKLVLLIHQNPPGRIIYHNQLHPFKTLPSLSDFIKYVKTNPQAMNSKVFFDYSPLGNVATITKLMMPTDNALVKEVTDCVGEDKVRRHQIVKETSRFGVKSKHGGVAFWCDVEGGVVVEIDKQKVQVEEEKIQQKKLEEGKDEEDKQEEQKEKEPTFRDQQVMWVRSNNILYKLWPYATFFNCNSSDNQTKRTIGPKGQTTRYFKDRSVWVGYANGDISWFRGGSWMRIQGNKKFRNGREQELKSSVTSQGNKQIYVRQDETIIIEQNSVRTVVFKDGTIVITDRKAHSTTVSHNSFPTVRIRLDPHRFIDQNTIGYGSAYAVLGFDNLFERSCDGFIYEVFAPQLRCYHYHEKVDKQGTKILNSVSVSYFTEGSVLKAVGDGSLVFIANEDRVKLDQQGNTEYWLQLFTTKENWREGVYHMDIEQGTIQTQDAEGNYFKLSLNKPSEAKIAVSLNINNVETEQPSFGNGYHVVKENFFLPTPANFIQPKLFVIRPNGSGVQLFSDGQLKNFFRKSQSRGFQLFKEKINEQQTYIQFTLTKQQQKIEVQKFTTPLPAPYQTPRCLQKDPPTLTQKLETLPPETRIRTFIKYNQIKGYAQYEAAVALLDSQVEKLKHRQKTEYKVLTPQELLT